MTSIQASVLWRSSRLSPVARSPRAAAQARVARRAARRPRPVRLVGSASDGGRRRRSARRAQLVACLKAHGVTLPTRPAGAGLRVAVAAAVAGPVRRHGGTTPRRGFFFGGGGARNITPKMRAAFKACGADFGSAAAPAARSAGGSRTRRSPALSRACNQHGYNLPAPNFSGKGPISPEHREQREGRGGGQGLPAPADPGATEWRVKRGDEYDIGGLSTSSGS